MSMLPRGVRCMGCNFGMCKGGPAPVVTGAMTPCSCDCHGDGRYKDPCQHRQDRVASESGICYDCGQQVQAPAAFNGLKPR